MSMEIDFLKAVRIAAFVLVIVLVVLVILALFNVLSAEVGISLYNLLIDVAVGVFTVWGLYWAASEFAKAQVEPDLHLIIDREGPDPATTEVLRDGVGYLIGREGFPEDGRRVSRVIVGLILENAKPKAARYVRIELWARDVPYFKEFVLEEDSFLYAVRGTPMPNRGVLLQFSNDLVVYGGGTPVYLGRIAVDWPQDTHPEKITFVARLYSLDSKLKEVTVSHPIRWMEDVA